VDLIVDRNGSVPLHVQVAEQLESAIARGEWEAGERIPTEEDLCSTYGLSRPTVRQAISTLVDKGLLVRKRGVGTQVLPSRVTRQVALSSLHSDLAASGHRPRTKVLLLEVIPASGEVLEVLHTQPGAEVWHVRRLRFDGAAPLAIMENWIPRDVVDLTLEALTQGSLYELLRESGVHLKIAHQRISAQEATADQAELLTVPKRFPLLRMERTAFDSTGRVVERAVSLYRSDSYSFETTLVDR